MAQYKSTPCLQKAFFIHYAWWGGGCVGFPPLARHSRKPFLHSRGTRARPVLAGWSHNPFLSLLVVLGFAMRCNAFGHCKLHQMMRHNFTFWRQKWYISLGVGSKYAILSWLQSIGCDRVATANYIKWWDATSRFDGKNDTYISLGVGSKYAILSWLQSIGFHRVATANYIKWWDTTSQFDGNNDTFP